MTDTARWTTSTSPSESQTLQDDVERAVSHQSATATQDLHSGQCQNVDLGKVVNKMHNLKIWLKPRFKGLFQMILAITVVKCGGLPNCVHASRTRMVPCPFDNTAPLQEEMPAVIKSPQKRVSQAVREHTESEAALKQLALQKQKVETDADESVVKRVNESGAASEEEISAVGLRAEVGKSWLKRYPKRLQWSLE